MTQYTDLCARLDYLSSPSAEHMPDGARLTAFVHCGFEAAAAIRELEADYKTASDQADALAAKLDDAEAKVARLEGELRWQAEQPEAHAFMAMRALRALGGDA